MNSFRALFAVAVVAAVVSLATLFVTAKVRKDPALAGVEGTVKDYLAQNPEQVQVIVRNYLMANPEILQEAAEELRRKRVAGMIHNNAALLFASPRQVTLGNPKGNVTLVEFFDYNCGYCRRALGDMMTLLKDDPNLRIVLKELPILSPASTDAAKVAVAVQMQDNSGQKYLAFHQALFGTKGVADKDAALAAAKTAGLDMDRLTKDIDSKQVEETIGESMKLAQALQIDGTPAYVIGDSIVSGAVGAPELKARIQLYRTRTSK